MKTLKELLDPADGTWKLLNEWLNKAKNQVMIIEPNDETKNKVIYQLQVSTKSTMGTVSYFTGGILVDSGWLRILGSGNPKFNRDLFSWNNLSTSSTNPRHKGCILIADDIVGGFFALNGGAFKGKQGEVFYLAPDTLEWESMDMSYSDFISWTFDGDIETFYDSFRWKSWKEDVMKLTPDRGILIYPYLWAEGSNIEERKRSDVPISELWDLNQSFKVKFNR